jgi:signal transduction histidine kinase
MEVKIAPADLSQVIKDVVDFLSPQLQTRGLSLKPDMPEMLIVYMDKNLIERVFINLISNAIKFTPKGGLITLGCKVTDNRVAVSVADTGGGIAKENLDKIFQEFFRVDTAINSEIKGTGLGLSLVKRIIEIHKEKIWVESELGKGSIFYFTLKLVKEKTV